MDQSIANKLDHIDRKLYSEEPLTGKLLETALEVIEEGKKGFSDENFLDNITNKLVSGHSLNEYEYHILIDVLFLHKRLSV
ncbi:MAG TPA: hypothetical protein VE912_22535 [Bacteroidales bacterium]|nr:hypothetical protein [Bacteroidales bacterium]